MLRVLQPFLQSGIIEYFNTKGAEKNEEKTYVYITCLVVCTILVVILTHHATLLSQQIGMRVRVACSSLVYRKV